jgi:hypothetical protein
MAEASGGIRQRPIVEYEGLAVGGQVEHVRTAMAIHCRCGVRISESQRVAAAAAIDVSTCRTSVPTFVSVRQIRAYRSPLPRSMMTPLKADTMLTVSSSPLTPKTCSTLLRLSE